MPVEMKVGDITEEKSCAIVNAANHSCMGGGGVDGAIHRAGGPVIMAACREIRRTLYPDGLPTGEAVATPAGRLPCRYVIHTVGPVWSRCGNRCDSLLASSYRRCLETAVELGCDSVAFPAISTGIYGFPRERAAAIACASAQEFLQKEPALRVIFVFHSSENLRIFHETATECAPEAQIPPDGGG
jgi:O-acetyl-ADP-ribose deacetylase (regulator of RNase III)